MTTITTPADLDALPEGSVVLDCDGNAWLNLDQGLRPGDPGLWRAGAISWFAKKLVKRLAPLTLLYRPDASPAPVVSQQATVEQAARVLFLHDRYDTLPGDFAERQWDEGHADRQPYLDRAQALAAAGLLSPRSITPEQREAAVRELHRELPMYTWADDCKDPDLHLHFTSAEGNDLCDEEPLGYSVCVACHDVDGKPMVYPCPTLVALDGESR